MFFSSKPLLTSVCFTPSSPLLRYTSKYFFLFWGKCTSLSAQTSLIQGVLFVSTLLPFKKEKKFSYPCPSLFQVFLNWSAYHCLLSCCYQHLSPVLLSLFHWPYQQVLETQVLIIVVASIIDRDLGSNGILHFGIWDSRSGSYGMNCWPVTLVVLFLA